MQLGPAGRQAQPAGGGCPRGVPLGDHGPALASLAVRGQRLAWRSARPRVHPAAARRRAVASTRTTGCGAGAATTRAPRGAAPSRRTAPPASPSSCAARTSCMETAASGTSTSASASRCGGGCGLAAMHGGAWHRRLHCTPVVQRLRARLALAPWKRGGACRGRQPPDASCYHLFLPPAVRHHNRGRDALLVRWQRLLCRPMRGPMPASDEPD